MSAALNPVPPVFFAHGSPTLAVEDTPASRFLKGFSRYQDCPNAVLILSAHWQTERLKLSAPGPLRTYHDFRGFPPELYEISYPASASEDQVDETAKLLEASGYDVELDSEWGLDHGAWVPLSLAFPRANIPVAALSLPIGSTPQSLYELGRAIAPLKEKGVLIAGSGSTTHNLGEMGPQGADTPGWVRTFDNWLEKGLTSGQISYFQNLEAAPDYGRNHPTNEHILPVFFPLGAAGTQAHAELLHRSYEYGSLSMSYFRFAA